MNPRKGVRIDIDVIAMDINRAVCHALWAVSEGTIMIVRVFPILFLSGCPKVYPHIMIDELTGVNLFSSVITLVLRYEQRLKGVPIVLVVAAPLYLLFPIEVWRVVSLSCLLVFCNKVSLCINLAEIGAGDRIPHIIYKLAILVVRNLRLIHIER